MFRQRVDGSTPAPSATGSPAAANAPVTGWRRLALVATGAVVIASLVVRVVHRGFYYPGFDLAGVANGLYVVSTRASFWDALTYVVRQSRDYGAPFPHYSVLAALLPGYLTAAWPWEYWAHVVTFGIVLVTIALILAATRLPLRDAWVVLLAWAASPALLSFSVAGFPWASAFLPIALALWVTLDPRLRRRWLLTLALCLVANELTWHVYEFGKTAFLVFAIAAVWLPDVPLGVRGIWLLAAALQVYGVFAHPSHHVLATGEGAPLGPSAFAEGLRLVGERLFVTPYLDIPVLLVAALVSCLAPSRVRWLLLVLLLGQMALLAVLAVHAPDVAHLRPRRYLTADFYALALVASFYRETTAAGTHRRLRRTVTALLVAGTVWQLVDLARFVGAPVDRRPDHDFAFTLPYTHSPSDYLVGFGDVDWARELNTRVERGEQLFLVYNLGAYDENVTNPEGILERLYVHLGHRRFVDSVLVFGSQSCRHTCLPVRPMDDLAPVLDALQAAPERLASLTGYVVQQRPFDEPVFVAERARMMAELGERFVVTIESPPGTKFTRFTLASRTPGA